MSNIRTRSGRVSKPPERLEIFEEVEDDYTDDGDSDFDEDDYDSESESESDEDEDADENGNLAGFIVDDEDDDGDEE